MKKKFSAQIYSNMLKVVLMIQWLMVESDMIHLHWILVDIEYTLELPSPVIKGSLYLIPTTGFVSQQRGGVEAIQAVK